MPEEKNYLGRALLIALSVVVLLIAIAFIPGFEFGKAKIRRANILSDVIVFDDVTTTFQTSRDLLDTSFLDSPAPADSLVSHAGVPPVSVKEAGETPKTESDVFPATKEPGAQSPAPTAPPAEPDRKISVSDSLQVCALTDYSPDGAMSRRFYDALNRESPYRTVRIAVLGDSFIEGDIMTADLREELQRTFGGSGVGFVPFCSGLAKYRNTVKHDFAGWKEYSVLIRKKIPENFRDLFCISGFLCIPEGTASAHYRGSTAHEGLERTAEARLLFAQRDTARVAATLDGRNMSWRLEPDSCLRILDLGGPVGSLDVTVDGAHASVGYGVVMEDTVGVSVHNFAVRSNSGLGLLATDFDLNRQLNEAMRYDLLILQYGLNAMSPDVTDYGYYGRQLRKVIEYMRLCFPQSAIMVMSVGDRSRLQSGRAETMSAVYAMIAAQRDAARQCGVLFWNTFDAMGGKGSMACYVANGWASKDHTHLNSRGGRQIALQLARTIREGAMRRAAATRTESSAAADSLRLPVDSLPITDSLPSTDTLSRPAADTLSRTLPVPDSSALDTTVLFPIAVSAEPNSETDGVDPEKE